VSPAIRALSSSRRFCALATSKKPPQMRKLVRRGADFGRDVVEHMRETTRDGRRNPERKSTNLRQGYQYY
jgi:hypothetical protein